jgi:hypothetical protein
LQINRLGWGLCACAQFCPQKMCRKRRPSGRCSRAPSCLFFILGNFFDLNQRLTSGKCDSSQIYPQKLWATTSARDAFGERKNFLSETQYCRAAFLRTEKYPLRIKELSAAKPPCAHFYPQKVCRTLLAANRATRYIAQLTCDVVFYSFRSSICSPFFKPPAGPSGCC